MNDALTKSPVLVQGYRYTGASEPKSVTITFPLEETEKYEEVEKNEEIEIEQS